jgi:hypothetical protein
MSTGESVGILLFTCAGNESNSKVQNRFKHSSETISRKFKEVLFCLMGMAKDFIRPKDPNFHMIHRRIRDDKTSLSRRGYGGVSKSNTSSLLYLFAW